MWGSCKPGGPGPCLCQCPGCRQDAPMIHPGSTVPTIHWTQAPTTHSGRTVPRTHSGHMVPAESMCTPTGHRAHPAVRTHGGLSVSRRGRGTYPCAHRHTGALRSRDLQQHVMYVGSARWPRGPLVIPIQACTWHSQSDDFLHPLAGPLVPRAASPPESSPSGRPGPAATPGASFLTCCPRARSDRQDSSH